MKTAEHSKNTSPFRAESVPRDHVRGHVYFVTCDVPDFPIKIGFTSGPKMRLARLGQGLPYPLVTLAIVEGSRRDERFVLRYYRKDRLRGEWFRRTPELMDTIARAAARQVMFPNAEVEEARRLSEIRRKHFAEIAA